MTANRERGEVDLIVKGKRFILRPGLNALARAEALTGQKARQLMTDAAEGSVTAQIALVWSYLQKYHAADFQTMDAVGDWIEDVGGLGELERVLGDLQRLNTEEMPPAQEGAAANPPEAQTTTGETSSSPVSRSA